MRDQRAKRFDSRRDLHLQSQGLHDWKKMPTDSAKFEGGSGLSVIAPPPPDTTSTDGLGVAPGTSVFEPAPVHDDDEDIENLNLLPRSAPKAKAKVKRTRTEMNRDECQRLRGELDNVMKELSGLPQLPKLVDLGRIERMLSKRVKDFKECSDFEASNQMQKYCAELETVRSFCKPAQSFLTGNKATRKKNEQDRPTMNSPPLANMT